MRIWLAIAAAGILTAAIVLYVLARRPAAVTVASPHDAAHQLIDAGANRLDALASDATAPADRRPPELDKLRSSGPAQEVWAPQASELLRGLDPHAEVECYVAGCGAMLTFASEDAYQHAVDTVAADRTWTGGKQWSAPVRAPGKITAALILYRPD